MTGPVRRLACPSAQPDMADAVVFGVITGTAENPRVAYLERRVGVDAVHRRLEGLEPTRVLRVAATCEQQHCAHHNGDLCTLAERVATSLPPVVSVLPRCAIRSTCRWYAEQGGRICYRCPQVVTLDGPRTNNQELAAAAKPPATSA